MVFLNWVASRFLLQSFVEMKASYSECDRQYFRVARLFYVRAGEADFQCLYKSR